MLQRQNQYEIFLCFDFTFDLGKSPLYFVLAVTYQNASLIRKNTKKLPALLSPVMICHKNDQKTVELFCDTILDKCPGLAFNVRVK